MSCRLFRVPPEGGRTGSWPMRKTTPRNAPCEALRILSLAELQSGMNGLIAIERHYLSPVAFHAWLERLYPDHWSIAPDVFNKKKIEFFATYSLLRIDEATSFLDAAGGKYSYAGRLRPGQNTFVQDLNFDSIAKASIGKNTTYIEASIATLPFADGSVDAIACHHSFEHLRNDIDTRFIEDLQRVLSPNGRAAILPIFIADRFAEISNDPAFSDWDSETSVHIYDPAEALPGGKRSGHYARVYSCAAFKSRVLDKIDRTRHEVRLLELMMGNEVVPDAALISHSSKSPLNVPYRLLMIEKRTSRSG
jgi:SAM-dependent methyltransferase